MAHHDVKSDVTPVQGNKRPNGPKVSDLRSALKAYNATSYSDARLDLMNANDMRYAAKLHGLSVPAL